jgi:hypothetical protein
MTKGPHPGGQRDPRNFSPGDAVFSGAHAAALAGHPPGAGTMAASDLYVLAGRGVLAATGVRMARR